MEVATASGTRRRTKRAPGKHQTDDIATTLGPLPRGGPTSEQGMYLVAMLRAQAATLSELRGLRADIATLIEKLEAK